LEVLCAFGDFGFIFFLYSEIIVIQNSDYNQHLIYLGVCFLVSLLGLFVRCFTIGYAPEKTSGRNTKQQVAETVNQTGIYSLIRHPLYVGNFFMFAGIALLTKSLSFVLIFFFIYWFYYERIMFTEEQFLRGKFAAKYLQWANRTPALIPRFTDYKKPEVSFSVRNILKREYPSLFGIILMFVLYDIMIVYFNEPALFEQGFPGFLKPIQIYAAISGIVFYVVVRIIVKFTKLLHVEGR
jgi:lipid A Kdo2 1-phosphate O-methyltransferase